MNQYPEEMKSMQDGSARRTAVLSEIIRPLNTAKYEVEHDWRYIAKALKGYEADYGGLDLNPDFQRGHVWTSDQKRHFIENALRGVVASGGFVVQFNCPNWDNDNYQGELPHGFQCIDGLQRITAIQDFINGEVRPFGLSVEDLDGSSFSMRRSRFRLRIAVHDFQTKADLLKHYLDLNTGGTPHSAEEIDRVRGLLAKAQAGHH